LVEISEKLQEIQMDNIMETLKNKQIFMSQDLKTGELYESKLNLRFKWVKDIEDIKNEEMQRLKKLSDKAKTNKLLMNRVITKENPFSIIAHELFDAIPVYQFIYDEMRGWLEKLVDIDPKDPNELIITESNTPTEHVKKLLQPEKRFNSKEMNDKLKTGDMIEISPHSQKIMTDISELVSISRGNALIIDYGEEQALTNSIRAIKDHKYLSEPEMLRNAGKADISAYVDFNALKHVAINTIGSFAKGPISQCAFLELMGMNIRKEVLKNSVKNKMDKKRLMQQIDTDYDRLTHPDQMGDIYKFMFVGSDMIGNIYPFIDEYTE